MFTSFDENVFRQAIKDKDYLCLKINTVSSMLDDPTFERGETRKVIDILDKEVPEIFEKYVELDYEERLDRSAWDKRYFTKLTYWFQENFAKERIAYIEEVGKAVHKDTAKQHANKYNATQNKPISTTAQPKAVPSASPKPKRPEKSVSKASKSSCSDRSTATQRKRTASTPNVKHKEKKTENFPTAGVLLTVGTLVAAGVLLFKLLVK